MRNWTQTQRRIAGFATIGAAFALGMALGDASWHGQFSPQRESSAVARYFAPSAAIRSGKATKPLRDAGLRNPSQAAPGTTPNARKLRLRSTARVTSGKARVGDPVIFLTDQLLEDVAGNRIPAGSLVEAVVAQAVSSQDGQPGRLVIEIRTLHVGNTAIPLRAAPYSLETQVRRAPAFADDWKPALAGRKLLRGAEEREAIVARESVLEFELLDPKAPARGAETAPRSEIETEGTPKPDQEPMRKPANPRRSGPRLNPPPKPVPA